MCPLQLIVLFNSKQWCFFFSIFFFNGCKLPWKKSDILLADIASETLHMEVVKSCTSSTGLFILDACTYFRDCCYKKICYYGINDSKSHKIQKQQNITLVAFTCCLN